jgi:predicted nucleic acid-binding Zn ribbon protein
MAKRYSRLEENLSLRDIIQAWMKVGNFTEKLYQEKVIAMWDSMVGPVIAKETDHIYIKNNVLIVRLKSQALRHEMEFARKKLVKSINNQVGREVIIDVKFI